MDGPTSWGGHFSPNKDLLDAQDDQDYDFQDEKMCEPWFSIDLVESLVVCLQDKIDNKAGVEDGRGDAVEGVGIGVLEHDQIHVHKTDSAHKQFPEAASLEMVDLGV